jgi:hypothetical protein
MLKVLLPKRAPNQNGFTIRDVDLKLKTTP